MPRRACPSRPHRRDGVGAAALLDDARAEGGRAPSLDVWDNPTRLFGIIETVWDNPTRLFQTPETVLVPPTTTRAEEGGRPGSRRRHRLAWAGRRHPAGPMCEPGGTSGSARRLSVCLRTSRQGAALGEGAALRGRFQVLRGCVPGQDPSFPRPPAPARPGQARGTWQPPPARATGHSAGPGRPGANTSLESTRSESDSTGTPCRATPALRQGRQTDGRLRKGPGLFLPRLTRTDSEARPRIPDSDEAPDAPRAASLLGAGLAVRVSSARASSADTGPCLILDRDVAVAGHGPRTCE